jgi:hypothetical protein
MKKRLFASLWFSLAVVLGALARPCASDLLRAFVKGQPRCQGKSTSYWRRELDYERCYNCDGSVACPSPPQGFIHRICPLATWRRSQEDGIDLIVQGGRDAIPVLTALLRDSATPRVRQNAACALGKIGPEAHEAVPALIEALEDPYAEVRDASACALGAIGPAAHRAVLALISSLRDQDAQVCRSAAAALGGIGPDAAGAVPALVETLSDKNQLVRAAAAYALEPIRITHESLQQLGAAAFGFWTAA